MHAFLVLIAKIFPLYIIIAAGFFAGRKLKVDRDTVATILIYLIAPVVVFNGVVTAPHESAYFLLPVVFFVVGSLLGLLFYKLGGLLWQRSGEHNLLGFVAGTGNTGYFGLPLVLSILGSRAQSAAIMATLGAILFENTVGYYFVAKNQATANEALRKVFHLPALYAFLAGVIISLLGYTPHGSIADTITYFKGAYVVFGMMIIGIGLAGVTRATFDIKFTAISFAAKFVAFPAVIATIIVFDNAQLHIFNHQIHTVMLLLAITPIASNTVAFATKLKAHPEKAAFTVLLSTLFALIYIPVFVTIFLT